MRLHVQPGCQCSACSKPCLRPPAPTCAHALAQMDPKDRDYNEYWQALYLYNSVEPIVGVWINADALRLDTCAHLQRGPLDGSKHARLGTAAVALELNSLPVCRMRWRHCDCCPALPASQEWGICFLHRSNITHSSSPISVYLQVGLLGAQRNLQEGEG